MSRDTFLKIESTFGFDVVNLLGGEPFLHPDILWQINRIAQYARLEHLGIPTNGSWILTDGGKLSKKLLSLAELSWGFPQGCFQIRISRDQYHRKFMKFSFEQLRDAVRMCDGNIKVEASGDSNRYHVVDLGRAKRKGISTSLGTKECDYFDPTIGPDGSVYACCMARNRLGNIDQDLNWWELYKSLDLENKSYLRCSSCPVNARFPVRKKYPIANQLEIEYV